MLVIYERKMSIRLATDQLSKASKQTLPTAKYLVLQLCSVTRLAYFLQIFLQK